MYTRFDGRVKSVNILVDTSIGWEWSVEVLRSECRPSDGWLHERSGVRRVAVTERGVARTVTVRVNVLEKRVKCVAVTDCLPPHTSSVLARIGCVRAMSGVER